MVQTTISLSSANIWVGRWSPSIERTWPSTVMLISDMGASLPKLVVGERE